MLISTSSFLTLPQVCTTTIQTHNLTALTRVLERAGLADKLDHLRNVTCISPSDEAFRNAGNPDVNDNPDELASGYVSYHTLTEPIYTNFLKDGQEFTSISNSTIRVTVNDTGTWFNEAK